MIKRIMVLMLIFIVIPQMTFAVDKPVTMRVNDYFINLNQPYLNIEGSLYAEASLLSACLGVVEAFYEESLEYQFIKYNKRLIYREGVIKAYVDDAVFALEEPIDTYKEDGLLYLPIRPFAEFFGAEVKWYSDWSLVTISDRDIVSSESVMELDEDLQDDLLWLARIVNIEARGGSIDKKIAVGNVVLNRVESTHFPNSVYDVIKQKGQFPPAYYSYFDTFEPTLESYLAAYLAMRDVNVAEDCLYFNLKPFSWKPKEDFFKEIEGDYFYR